MTTDTAAWQKAKENFDRDGFTVLKGFLSGRSRDQWLEQVDRFIADVLPTLPPKTVLLEDKSRPETFLYVSGMDKFDSYFRELLEEGSCRQLTEFLLGQPASPVSASIFNKPPRVGRGTPPHQDAYYWMLDPNEALTLWIAVDRSDEGNGCVRYVPGSHTSGIRPHEPSKAFGFSQKISDFSSADEQAEVAVPIEPGDLIAHHCMTIHRTEDNLSDRSRRGLGLVYYAQRAKVDEARHKAYNEKVKQGWTNEKRF